MPTEPQQTLHQALSTIRSLAASPMEPKQPIDDDDYTSACGFVTQLVTHAYRYGASLIRLQTLMSNLPQLFGFHGVMLAASPFFFFEFWRQDDAQPSRVTVRQPVGSFDLSKLSQLGILVNELTDGKLPISEGISRLSQIDSLPLPYARPVVALGYALCGAGFAVLLAAGWLDVLFAALLSLVVYAFTVTTARSPWVSNRLNFAAAFVASVLANLLALWFPGSNPFVVSLCAVIVLVPGLALTLGIAELSAKIVISGITRLADGILVTLALVVGNAVGTSLINALWSVPAPADALTNPAWVTMLSIVLLMVGLAFVFQVRPPDVAWVILAGALAYAGVTIGGQLGNWQGSFLGAFMLGFYASLYSLLLRRPSSVVMVPGIMILVPGVAAYFGLNLLQMNGIMGALPAVWGVITQSTAILAGLFVAASVIRQNSSL